MLKFVRALTIIYLLSLLYTVGWVIPKSAIIPIPEMARIFNYSILTIFIISAILISPASIVLLYNNHRFSPDFEFQNKQPVIMTHFAFINIILLLVLIALTCYNSPSDEDLGDPFFLFLAILFFLTFISLLPLINFFSIFKNRFTIAKETTTGE